MTVNQKDWIKIEQKKPCEGQNVEFPADKERDGVIDGKYSNGEFFSWFDGYHEPTKWRPS